MISGGWYSHNTYVVIYIDILLGSGVINTHFPPLYFFFIVQTLLSFLLRVYVWSQVGFFCSARAQLHMANLSHFGKVRAQPHFPLSLCCLFLLVDPAAHDLMPPAFVCV